MADVAPEPPEDGAPAADGSPPPRFVDTTSRSWDLEVGQTDTRTALHRRFGGSQSRGISAPGRGTGGRDVMLWWRPERGELFGYRDGWSRSGDAFYFSGTGQVGDQRFGAPNAENGRIRDHEDNGDALRLLKYVGKNEVVYLGELRVDGDDPWRWRDAPDRFGTIRKVIEFRLLPVGQVLRDESDPVREEPLGRVEEVGLEPVPTEVPVETLGAALFEQVLTAQRRLARRRELELVHDFRRWLEGEGVAVSGLRIPYAPERRNLRADLYLPGVRTLIEAKASASRENIRAAIGQLLDYRRWIEPRPRLCVLVPSEVPDDMVSLLDSLSIGTAWPSDDGFVVSPGALLHQTPDGR